MAAALEASRRGARCLVLEGMDSPGKKILASGNGRCNLTNLNITANDYHSSHLDFCAGVLEQWSCRAMRRYWAQLGLATREEEDRIYPYSLQARSVLRVIAEALRNSSCKINLDSKVNGIKMHQPINLGGERKQPYYTVYTTDGRHYTAPAVILASGGMAAPALGSDGSGYALFTELGHRLIHPQPALVQLLADGIPKRLSGTRCRVSLRLGGRHGKGYAPESGELLFTDYGLSGICALNLSAGIAHVLQKGRAIALHIDFLPDIIPESALKITKALRESQPNSPASAWGLSYLPEKLSALLFAQLGRELQQAHGVTPRRLSHVEQLCLADLDDETLFRLVRYAKDWTCRITGTKGFGFAQVTRGGLDTQDFNPYTLQSLICPGLFACGEVLDVDGRCGGYNLHWAFASGNVAGQNAALIRRS